MIDTLAHLEHHDRNEDRHLRSQSPSQSPTDIIHANAPLHPISTPASPRIWRALGLHPAQVTPTWPATLEQLRQHSLAPDIVAIGEIGLDKRPGMPDAALQEAAFLSQLELARAHNLPIIIHCIAQRGRLFELLTRHLPPPRGFTLHAFSGPAEMVPAWAALGAHFSFGGLVTRPEAKKCHAAATVVPIDRLLVESDTPDMPAAGWEGPSTPAMLPLVLAAVARLRGAPLADITLASVENARRLYNIARPSKMNESQ